jgi:hypothetical protein
VIIATNDDWSTSALITTADDADPGSYTAIVSAKGAATGIALVEVFELP